MGLYYYVPRWLRFGDSWAVYDFFEKYDAWYKSFGPEFRGPQFPEDGAHLDEDIRKAALAAMGTFNVAFDAQLGRRCFMTKEGYVGLGPGEMREGDVVVVLRGATVPMILRPGCGDRDGQFDYVGEAYCHGIMDGELLSEKCQKRPTMFSMN